MSEALLVEFFVEDSAHRELADAMDLFRAGKNDSSLKAFVEELRDGLRRAPPGGMATSRS